MDNDHKFSDILLVDGTDDLHFRIIHLFSVYLVGSDI